jgi:hypothetical protein
VALWYLGWLYSLSFEDVVGVAEPHYYQATTPLVVARAKNDRYFMFFLLAAQLQTLRLTVNTWDAAGSDEFCL